MPLLPESLIDEVQVRTDIAEVIGRYIPLKRAGRHFKANCPFHKERTPSFMVNTDKQIYHCFGCGTGGNVFSFLMQHDRLTFPEAVRQLADHVGLAVPEARGPAPDGAHERLARLMEQSCAHFEKILASPQTGRAAREYLARRGVSDATRARFRLGFAPAGWDHLSRAAEKAGVTTALLEEAGLAVKGRSGHYDRFRNRVMFPILDVRGRIVGFGGRSLDGAEPKYLNSPETPLYTKGRHLFGMAQAKEAVMAAKTAVVVEGYFDCVVLANAGIAHTVSPLGTALTPEQARLLKRYAERVILAFDPDAAGEQATLRGIDVLVETGLRVDVAQLPQGADPDELLRSMGRERFEALLEQSVSVFEFLIQAARRRHPGRSAEEKVRAARFILPTIAKVPDAMLRREYVKLLAQRLQLDEAAVAEELRKVPVRGFSGAADTERRPAAPRALPQGPEALLVALLLDDPGRWASVSGHVSVEDLADPSLREIAAVIAEAGRGERAPTTAQIVSRLSAQDGAEIAGRLVELARSVESPEQGLDDCLRRLQMLRTQRQRDQVRVHMRAAEQEGRDDDVQRLLVEYQQLLSSTSGAGRVSLAPPRGG